MTFSIYSPLLSLLLEQRGASNFLIGSLATTPAIGVMLSSFFVPYFLKMAGGKKVTSSRRFCRDSSDYLADAD